MKIFETHDNYYDYCRSFLVLSMIFTHVYETFYIPDYNRSLTIFVTIGFVFLSGFSIGALYTERIEKKPKENFFKMMGRGVKLLIIFLVCNAIILGIFNDRWHNFSEMDLREIVLSITLGTDQSIYGFDILVPIAMTTVISYLLLLLFNNRFDKTGSIIVFILIVVSEGTNFCNYYGTILTLTGLAGCTLGKLSSRLDWDRFIQMMYRSFSTTILGIIVLVYYLWIFSFVKTNDTIQVGYHVLPTVILLFFVYMVSIKFSATRKRVIDELNNTLSSYMLFLYLFHILAIQIFMIVIPKDSLNGIECFFYSLFLIFLSLVICRTLSALRRRYLFFSKAYDTIFKL